MRTVSDRVAKQERYVPTDTAKEGGCQTSSEDVTCCTPPDHPPEGCPFRGDRPAKWSFYGAPDFGKGDMVAFGSAEGPTPDEAAQKVVESLDPDAKEKWYRLAITVIPTACARQLLRVTPFPRGEDMACSLMLRPHHLRLYHGGVCIVEVALEDYGKLADDELLREALHHYYWVCGPLACFSTLDVHNLDALESEVYRRGSGLRDRYLQATKEIDGERQELEERGQGALPKQLSRGEK